MVLFPLTVLLMIDNSPDVTERIAPPEKGASGKVLLSTVRPPVSVKPASVTSKLSSVTLESSMLKIRELSSSRVSSDPATSVMNVPLTNKSLPLASPVMTTSVPSLASIVRPSVIDSSPRLNRIRLLNSPVKTSESNVIVSSPATSLAIKIASRSDNRPSEKSSSTKSLVVETTNPCAGMACSSNAPISIMPTTRGNPR